MSSDAQWWKRIIGLLLVLGLGGSLIVGLTKSIYELLSVNGRVSEAESRVETLRSKKQQLEDEYFFRTSPDYLEQEIRNKLSLAKPADTVLLLPDEIEASRPAFYIPPTAVQLPIWRQWWELFFGK